MDMNDRSSVKSWWASGKANGFVRQDGFMITVASEIMAILCLSNDLMDLKKDLAGWLWHITTEPVACADLVNGAMAVLKDAIKPNWYRPWKTHRHLFTADPLPI